MLYFSSTAYDYSTRTAFTAAAVRVIPPYNPFFASNPPIALRYHYFWMLICSLPVRLGHMEPQQAMYGGTIWAGIVLMSLIAISLKFFMEVRERLERKAMIACSLLLVTGLDILPTLYIYLHSHQVNADMEWWTDEQITSWIDSLLWVPHHVMSLVACMVGLLVLRQPAATKYRRAVAILIAGLAFASAAGLSILVAFTFAVFGGLWLIVAAQRKWWDDVKGLLAAGGVALVAAFPYLYTLTGPALDGSARGGRFFALSIRGFSFGTWLLYSRIHIFPRDDARFGSHFIDTPARELFSGTWILLRGGRAANYSNTAARTPDKPRRRNRLAAGRNQLFDREFCPLDDDRLQ